MDVMVVRHGIALDREDAIAMDVNDRDRPLTRRGRLKTKRVARTLARHAPSVTTLFTSPLRRAIETAEIVGEAYGDLQYSETAALLPEAEPSELSNFLAESASGSHVAVVGHEPHLSSWIGWSLSGFARSLVDLRKAGACLVRFEDAPEAAKGRLIWLLPPALLRGH
jgi:phosphohistidine phosphatase